MFRPDIRITAIPTLEAGYRPAMDEHAQVTKELSALVLRRFTSEVSERHPPNVSCALGHHRTNEILMASSWITTSLASSTTTATTIFLTTWTDPVQQRSLARRGLL